MSDSIKAAVKSERQTVRFIEGLEVDGYRMPSGEFRVGITSASLVLGYGENWLYRVLENKTGKSVKALQGLGFSGQIVKTVSQSIRGGGATANTISLDDFGLLAVYATQEGKKAAAALCAASVKLSFYDFFRDAFGEAPASIAEKRRIFYQAYAKAISGDEWREMQIKDIVDLALDGDERSMEGILY